ALRAFRCNPSRGVGGERGVGSFHKYLLKININPLYIWFVVLEIPSGFPHNAPAGLPTASSSPPSGRGCRPHHTAFLSPIAPP
ncbi:hypothetical protein CHU92_00325, partial [Flavobacterium cyanobacteriorum]